MKMQIIEQAQLQLGYLGRNNNSDFHQQRDKRPQVKDQQLLPEVVYNY